MLFRVVRLYEGRDDPVAVSAELEHYPYPFAWPDAPKQPFPARSHVGLAVIGMFDRQQEIAQTLRHVRMSPLDMVPGIPGEFNRLAFGSAEKDVHPGDAMERRRTRGAHTSNSLKRLCAE